nr:hypothetical protein [Tanacetum cinerariifolium]
MTLFNEIGDNCIYGTGMPIICTECGGIVRGGLCLPCDLREKDLYNYDPNAYSFDNSNCFPQPQDDNYLCNLCGNNSHDGYDCQKQFPFVNKQEPSYNQNGDDNYYPHESLSFPCCDYCGGSHETFQCQPDNQNVDFSGSDQIQTPQYPDVNPPSPEIKYDQSTRTNRPIFLNDDEGHYDEIADLEPEATTDTELSGTEDIHPLAVQEPPQDSDICQLINECCKEVPDALDSKLLSINSIKSQRLDKKEQEVKNVEEQPAERTNRAEKSLQKFRVVHKSSISLKDTSQISSIHEVAPILSTKEPEHLLNEIECDMPAKDVCSPVFTTFSNPLFKDNDDLDKDVLAEEFKFYSNPLCDEDKINSDKLDPHCFNIESDFVKSLLNRDTFIDFSSKIDFSGELVQKSNSDFEEEIRLYNSFPRPPEELNAEIADTIIESIPLPIPVQDGNSQQEEIDIVTSSNDVLPSSVENDDDDYDLLLEEVDLFLFDDSIPPGIKNIADVPEGDVRFLEELIIDDSILSHESFDSNFEVHTSISRPPLEPPDDNFGLEPEVISAVMEDNDEPDEHFNLGGEIFVSTNIEDVDYFPFMFVIRIFLPYLTFLRFLHYYSPPKVKTPYLTLAGLFSRSLKISYVGYCPGFQDLCILCLILVWGSPYP